MKFNESVITDEPVKGLSTFIIPTKVKDVVTISGSMLGGILFSGNENNKISSLTSSMLDKGTQNKSKHQISDELESMGAEISFISSNRHINFTAHCLKSDLGLVVELVAEQLKHPIFPEEELALLKKRMIGNLEISKDDTKKQALISFLQELYPEKHHNYRNSIEEAIKRIELVGLMGFEHQYPEQLSGGMQQRVGLARALATDPDVLLMDEAFSALDPLIRSDMQRQLIELQAKMHKTIVFITHDLDEALRLGDEIAILNGGRLVQVGKPEDIVLRPADDYVSAFVADVNTSRVLRARSIMIPAADFSLGKKKTEQVHKDTFLEEIVPTILEKRAVMAVVDNAGDIMGYISDKELGRALSKQ